MAKSTATSLVSPVTPKLQNPYKIHESPHNRETGPFFLSLFFSGEAQKMPSRGGRVFFLSDVFLCSTH